MTKVILVNKNDIQTGIADKMNAHKQGFLHRAFSIMIYNSKNQMLIHQRAFNKYHCSGLWSNACCSHPQPDIDINKHIHERLIEEMGFDCDLKWHFSFQYKSIFDNGLTENELDHVYWGIFENQPQINRNEVANYKWVNISDIIQEIQTLPEIFTPWFKIIIEDSILRNEIQKTNNGYIISIK